VQADLAPAEAAQMPQAADLAPRRVGDRLQRLKEKVYRMGEIMVQQSALINKLSTNQSRFAMWMIGRMTQLMDDSGLRYQEFDGSFVGSSHVGFIGVWQRYQDQDRRNYGVKLKEV
ncbi:hypothetical protein Tco_1388815, partial [Tanacetum coccineum]